MPAREMKARFVQREWFMDYELMTAFTAEEREVYLGLAMLMDSGGWLPWNLPEVANAIYRFVPLADAERVVSAAADRLSATGRLKIYRCGHAHMPKAAKQQRPGVQEFRVQEEHDRCRSKGGQSKINRDQSQINPDHRKPFLSLPNRKPNPKSIGNQDASAREGRPAGPDGPVSLGSVMDAAMPGMRDKLKGQAGGR